MRTTQDVLNVFQKNNQAAKRSREMRKLKENQANERAIFLEKQHDTLRLV